MIANKSKSSQDMNDGDIEWALVEGVAPKAQKLIEESMEHRAEDESAVPGWYLHGNLSVAKWSKNNR